MNGGAATEKTFNGLVGSSNFELMDGTLKTGDTVKVTLEIDPSKTSQYRAGTMERSALV